MIDGTKHKETDLEQWKARIGGTKLDELREKTRDLEEEEEEEGRVRQGQIGERERRAKGPKAAMDASTCLSEEATETRLLRRGRWCGKRIPRQWPINLDVLIHDIHC